MDIRQDTWTGGEHYWIRFNRGTFEVRKEKPDIFDNNTTVFVGHYDKCVDWLKNKVAENYEYDHDL